MKKIVLKVIQQCVATDGVDPDFIKTQILPKFFKHFWVRRMALDRRNYKQLVETTVAIAQKVGVSEIVAKIVEWLKDESEPFRRLTIETVEAIVRTLGSTDLDDRMVKVLIDGILFAFQEQSGEDNAFLNGFGTVVKSLGLRVKPYLEQITSTILWRLNNKSAKVRQQSAGTLDLKADCRFDYPNRNGDAALWRGQADGSAWRCALRVFGRRVPRGAGVHYWSAQGHRTRYWHEHDDSANQGYALFLNGITFRLASASDANSKESARKGARAMCRPCWPNRRPRSRVRYCT
jgi:hypothetical protein